MSRNPQSTADIAPRDEDGTSTTPHRTAYDPVQRRASLPQGLSAEPSPANEELPASVRS